MSSSNDSNSKSYYSKNHHHHRKEKYYRDYSKSKSRNGSKYYNRNRSREREREREESKYKKSNREIREKKSHSRKPQMTNNLEKSNNNIIINKPNIISQEKKTEEEIALERMKRKAKAQLLIMLDNEEKIRSEENKYKETKEEEMNLDEEENLEEKVNNNLSNNINEIGIDPLDEFMSDFNQKNKIVKQVETFENEFENKNTITLEEINKTIKGEENSEKSDTEENNSSYHEEFMNAINNTLNDESNANKIKNVNNISNNSEAMVLYDEDHYEYKSNISQNNELDNIWKSMKNNIDKEKDLKPVDHSKMNYDYFTKNIYIESPEITKLTQEEVIEIRKNNGSILVKGKDIPKPILDFYQCGLNTKIMEILSSKQIEKPFPIQMQAIPTIMSGRDCLGISETGSGKTLAYVLPMLRHVQSRLAGIKLNKGGINTNYKLKNEKGPIALILVPTRELATQICEEIRSFTNILSIDTACLFGGSNLGNQINDLKRGVDIAVATPARLIELLCLSSGRITNLTRTTFVVLDEADRMFDLGFEPQISKIIRNIRPQRQIVMFSATFPRQIQLMAKKLLKKPVEILVGLKGQGAKNIEQHVEIIKKEKSFLRLLEILEKYIELCTIIFVDEQNEAIELWKQLFKKGFSCCLLYGQMDQEDRIDNLESFKKGQKNILVTTSICARGLDVPRCGLVVNFRCPNHMEDYIHRIGRTGRAGRKGIAYTFIDPDEEDLYAEDIIKVMEISNQEISEELKEIARNYRRKLLRGEAEKFRISGYLGRGYQFNKLEKEKRKLEIKLLGQQEDNNNNDINDDDIEEMKLIKDEENKEKEKKDESKALVIRKKSLIEQHKERMKLMRRDPKAKQMALDIGMKAAKAAFIAGKKEEEILKIVQDAITKGLANYKPNVSLKEGAENASKIIEEWEAVDNMKKHVFSCEFEINEYPVIIRNKLTKKEFLKQLGENEDVDIIQRGTICEPGKTLLPGHKPLQLLIKGKTQFAVNRAYINIKRYFDEAALNYFTHYDADYIGKISKFHI
jgi:ATP-dependent RNA helicase DDX46/PRP5